VPLPYVVLRPDLAQTLRRAPGGSVVTVMLPRATGGAGEREYRRGAGCQVWGAAAHSVVPGGRAR
jgi:hypothetical protein